MNVFRIEDGCLKFHYDAEELWIQPWGHNSFRVRGTKTAKMPKENWALQMTPEEVQAKITIEEDHAEIVNGKLRARLSAYGKLTFYNKEGKVLLDEYLRNRLDVFADYCSALEVEAREYRPIPGGDYHLSMRFVSNTEERLYGMGQYQQPNLNLKGTDLELAQRNSQASVPFARVFSGIWISLEQSGCRTGSIWKQYHHLGGVLHKSAGLLDHCRRHAG